MKRIVVSITGEGADEKAQMLEECFRKIILENGIRNAAVQIEKELEIPSFVNEPYYEERRPQYG